MAKPFTSDLSLQTPVHQKSQRQKENGGRGHCYSVQTSSEHLHVEKGKKPRQGSGLWWTYNNHLSQTQAPQSSVHCCRPT